MEISSKRRLTTILATDVAGFSRLVAADEEGTLSRLALIRGAFEDIITRHQGRIFNTAGDAIRAEFPSAIDAVRCAVALQEAASTLEGDEPPDSRIVFRIGIAIGDVAESGTDLLGDGVSLAERLESMAPKGGLCIARSVHDAVSGKTAVAFAEVDGPAQPGGAPVKAFAAKLSETTQKSGAAMVDQPTQPSDSSNAKPPPSSSMRSWLSLLGLTLLAFVGTVMGLVLFRTTEPEPTPKPADAPKSAPVSPPATRPAPAPSPVPAKPAPAPEQPRVEPVPAKPAPAPPLVPPKPAPAPAPEQPRIEPVPAKPEPVPPPVPPKPAPSTAINWKDCDSPKVDTAISGCRSILSAPGLLPDADAARANFQLGKALLLKGELDDAVTALDTSIKRSPVSGAYNSRGIAHFQRGRLDASIDDFTEAIKLDRNNGEAFNNRAWSRYKANMLRDALADAEEATRLVSDKSYAWDTKGHINEALGNRPSAIADYRRSIELDKNAEDSREGLKRLGAEP